MIEVQDLTKFYGNFQALKGISFDVQKGEILGFLGPNGAGKTTTMRILTCFFPATGGTARVAGFDVFEEPLEVRKRMGYLPENVPLYRDMVAEDYLTFVAGIKGIAGRDIKKRVESVMGDCGITHMRRKLVGQMSKGYRQRVGLAQSLVNDPEVLILDEPTIGLDPKQIVDIRALIKGLAGRRTVILCTHILPEVSMTCKRVVIINDGGVIAVDTPQNLTMGLHGAVRFIARVDGPSSEVLKCIRSINGVKSAEVYRGPAKSGAGGGGVDTNNILLELEKDVTVRRNISHAIVNGGWGLLELRPHQMSLEDIFIKLVTKE